MSPPAFQRAERFTKRNRLARSFRRLTLRSATGTAQRASPYLWDQSKDVRLCPSTPKPGIVQTAGAADTPWDVLIIPASGLPQTWTASYGISGWLNLTVANFFNDGDADDNNSVSQAQVFGKESAI